MMFQILFGLFIFFSANNLSADVPPMVERHIFTPGNVIDQKEKGLQPSIVHLETIQKEILFTGLLITPMGKQAIITENPKNDRIKSKNVLREGDQIKGMTIKEIGSNYLLLAGREGDVRLNLYRGAKNRPVFDQVASMPVTQTTVTSAAQSQINQTIEKTAQGQTRGLPISEVKPVFSSGNPQQGLPAASGGAGTSQQGLPAASGGAGTSQQGLPTASGGAGTSQQGLPAASGAGTAQQELPTTSVEASQQGLPVFGGGNIPQHAFPPTGGPQFVLPPIGGSQQALPPGGQSQQGLPQVGTPLK